MHTDHQSSHRDQRSGSFGAVASDYERFRPGPPPAAIDWLLEGVAGTVVDLGAGTGAMTKQLVGRVDRIVAVEPDDRMRDVLVETLPGVTALRGTGESMPVDRDSVGAVLASNCWHWMDREAALLEISRVLAPGGTLGVMWAGPDPEGPFVAQAQTMLSANSSSAGGTGGDVVAEADLGREVMDTDNRVETVLRIRGWLPVCRTRTHHRHLGHSPYR